MFRVKQTVIFIGDPDPATRELVGPRYGQKGKVVKIYYNSPGNTGSIQKILVKFSEPFDGSHNGEGDDLEKSNWYFMDSELKSDVEYYKNRSEYIGQLKKIERGWRKIK